MARKNPFQNIPNKPLPSNENKFLMDTLGFGQQFYGDVRVGNKGGGEVLLDGANNRIIINDGTTDRILIGFQLDGF